MTVRKPLAVLSLALSLALAASLAGCCSPRKALRSVKPMPAGIVELKAADGGRVLVQYGGATQGRALVYLHGRCDDPREALAAFAAAVTGQGHVVAPVGAEGGCPGGNSQWGDNLEKIDRQLRAAVAAAEAHVGGSWDESEQVLVGYSQGAARGEALLPLQPRFRRVIFVGSPDAPDPRRYKSVTAAAFLAGERDRHDLMLTGEQSLKKAGKPAKFFVLPGADHGKFGPEGGPVMAAALAFVLAPG